MIRLGALGDVVRTLPAATAVRDHYPTAHLAWLVEPRCASALRDQPWIDEVIELPREVWSDSLRRGRWVGLAVALQRFASGLRARRFDLVVDFHSILKSGVASALSRAPVRAGLAPPLGREGAWWFANRRIAASPAPVSRFARNRALVRGLGIEAPERSDPLRVPQEAVQRMGAALRASGLDGEAGFAVLHPGSSPATPHKRWSPDRFGALARTLAARRGIPSAVLWGDGADEQARARAVVEASGGAARPAPPTVAFAELAALLRAARLFVGGDSGPLHAASLVGTPVVQVMGPTHPVENTPWDRTPWRRVRIPVACSPCRRGCAAAHCLSVVPPETVARAALALLDDTGTRGAEARRVG